MIWHLSLKLKRYLFKLSQRHDTSFSTLWVKKVCLHFLFHCCWNELRKCIKLSVSFCYFSDFKALWRFQKHVKFARTNSLLWIKVFLLLIEGLLIGPHFHRVARHLWLHIHFTSHSSYVWHMVQTVRVYWDSLQKTSNSANSLRTWATDILR